MQGTIKSIQDWDGAALVSDSLDHVKMVEGRKGMPTLEVNDVLLHSRYNPVEEAQRLIESALLNPERPVMVIGIGLGYHVMQLLEQGFTLLVLEPDPAVVRQALQVEWDDHSFLLGTGAADSLVQDSAFKDFISDTPQLLIHPPTAKLHEAFTTDIEAALSTATFADKHLNIAIVGPLYGGSLPIAQYLADAFQRLGHCTRYIDNSHAWDLYDRINGSVKDVAMGEQLSQMYTKTISEWTYAQVAEFDPEICIVLAQAPVDQTFPLRMMKRGTVTAFWYVENWRHMPYWKEIAPYYDYFFHIQPGEFESQLDSIGCQHHAYVQTACDPIKHAPVTLEEAEQDDYSCDISFAGAGYYNRHNVFKGLTDYDFKLWGVEWGDRELYPLVQGGEKRFDSEAFMKIVAGTHINLNLHSSQSHPGVDPKCDAINPRVFEIAAAGAFQVCDPCIGLEELFDFETELPVYRDLKELRSLIEHYLAHPEERKAIAKRAQERVLKDHTYEKRAQQMLDLILAEHGARILKKGIRVQRTIGEVAERLDKDVPLRKWLESLPEDVLFTQENVNAFLKAGWEQPSYPEQVFTYMKEVRDFSELLLKEKR